MTTAPKQSTCQEPIYGPLGTCVGTCGKPAADKLFGMNLCQEHFDTLRLVMKGSLA